MRVTPTSRRAWRAWLESHHETAAEVWLVFYKRGAGKPTLSYGDAVEEAICFGWIDGVRRSLDGERYMHRFSPRRPDSRWSAANRDRAERMTAAGWMAPAGRKAIERARRSGRWDTPRPRIDLSLPPELEERLRESKSAAEFFASLAPSYRKQFIAWINTAKRIDTKQRRLDETMRLLERREKLGMR